MSVEEAVTDALQTPVDQNAQAAEDAKRMLAELQGDTESKEESTNTSGAVEKTEASGETTAADAKDADGETATTEVKNNPATETSPEKRDASDKNREHRQRSDHSGRGRGRGGQNGSRNYRDNIKSDLTSQETSSDPVAIRKQVQIAAT